MYSSNLQLTILSDVHCSTMLTLSYSDKTIEKRRRYQQTKPKKKSTKKNIKPKNPSDT